MTFAFDAIVIGAGAGGGAAAWRLTQRGCHVLVLEAGPWFDPDKDYGLDRPDWESRFFPAKEGSAGRHLFGEMQKLDPQWDDLRSWHHETGRLIVGDRRAVRGGYSHVRGVGGSTLHYVGEAHRLNPHAMALRTQYGVGADWPFDYAELEPYYDEVERLIGVAGPAEVGDRWRSHPYPLPAHPLSLASRTLAIGAQSLGLRWEPNPRAALSRPYDGRPPCNYCGGCARGCPRRDKGSVDQTFIRHAVGSGKCEVRARSTVLSLLHDDKRVVRGVRYVDAKGRQHTVAARLVILAAGAIETPRILLANRSTLAPHGIGNDMGQVGQHFMETLSWMSMGLHPDALSSYAGLPADAICWDHNRPDAIPDVVGGVRIYSATLDADLMGPVAYATRMLSGWGARHKQQLRQTFGHALAVGAIGESLPHPGSFIDLHPSARDRHGMPLARIHSHVDDMACRRLRFMAQTCRAVLKASGCEDLRMEIGTYDDFTSTHVFGTCRLGVSPDNSVCNEQGQIHGWDNLLLCDGSTFPSSGGGESPSLTIEALALRAVDRFLGAG
ncbi:MAG: GMC family oxidoreductase [Acidobacteriota bacterium]